MDTSEVAEPQQTSKMDALLDVTHRGLEEIAQPSLGLSLRQRMLLSALDGQRTLQQLIDAEPRLRSDRVDRDAARLRAVGLVDLLSGTLPELDAPPALAQGVRQAAMAAAVAVEDASQAGVRRPAPAPAEGPATVEVKPATVTKAWRATVKPQVEPVVVAPAQAAQKPAERSSKGDSKAQLALAAVAVAAAIAAFALVTSRTDGDNQAANPSQAASSPTEAARAVAPAKPIVRPATPPAAATAPAAAEPAQVAAVLPARAAQPGTATPAATVAEKPTPSREVVPSKQTTKPVPAAVTAKPVSAPVSTKPPPAPVVASARTTPVVSTPALVTEPVVAAPAPSEPPKAASAPVVDVPKLAVASTAAIHASAGALQPIDRVPPAIPRDAMLAVGASAVVRARLVISDDGAVERVQILNAGANDGAFEREAQRAAQNWVFKSGAAGRLYEAEFTFSRN